MSRIKLLQPKEIILFNQAPLLNLEEKTYFFSLSSPFDEEFKELRDGYAKIGFILQLGYFKNAGRFYGANQFHKAGIEFVIKQLGWRDWENKVANFQDNYSYQASYKHRLKILALSG